MEASKALQSLKVPELKAKCKELKIPNFSKLSKADLIAKIIEAGKGTGSTTHSQTGAQQPTPEAPKSVTSKEDDAIAEIPLKKKEGNIKKRKATDQSGPSSKSSREESEKDVEAGSHTTKTLPHVQATDPNITSIATPEPVVNPADPTKSTKTVKSKATATAKSKVNKKVPAPMSTSTEADKPVSKTNMKAQAAAGPKTKVKATLAPMTQTSTLTENKTNPPTFWKIQNPTASSRNRPIQSLVRPVQPRFTGLVSTKPAESPTSLPTVQETEVDLSTTAARIEFIEAHFLNTLFTLLHQYRAKSTTSNYPCPAPFAQSTKYAQTSHLAFQGFHPDVYDSEAGFKVAIRFWIARLHSYMQLGSGEAWSGGAGGMGMLGPDMATWPAITGVEMVTEEVCLVKTKEEMEEVRYLVMAEIGEVIASSRGITGNEELISGCVVRNDWAKYLGSRDPKSLHMMVKTKESYDFPNGVARSWAARQSEGMVKIANRAVLASCALNSFSGEKMSSTVMDAAHIGRPALGVASNDLDFYLPENSQILSVHRPVKLHPDLAIVHRGSGYSEFVLVETGQMVGLEDEGVVSLWQGLLGCNAKGEKDESGQKAFWKGWESRMKFMPVA